MVPAAVLAGLQPHREHLVQGEGDTASDGSADAGGAVGGAARRPWPLSRLEDCLEYVRPLPAIMPHPCARRSSRKCTATFLPGRAEPIRQKPSATDRGSRRDRGKATRNAGFSWAVSALALMSGAWPAPPLLQCGISPQRTMTASRRPSAFWRTTRTTGTACVGATLKAGRPGLGTSLAGGSGSSKASAIPSGVPRARVNLPHILPSSGDAGEKTSRHQSAAHRSNTEKIPY